jgi:hypothetical protein
MGLYDISGTSNIINLAHRTISIKRVTDREKEKLDKPYDCLVNVLKDRIRGRAGKTCGLFYDVPTRRFYTSMAELSHSYRWDANAKPITCAYPPDEAESEVFGQAQE